jgi:hypothetical protein
MQTEDESRTRLFCVLGMHRSGTSAVAGGLVASGVYFGGQLMAAKADNPKGFYENQSLVTFHDKLLALHMQRWDSVTPLPAPLSFCEREKLQGEALAIVEEIREHKGVVGCKDPRISLFVPFWLEVFSRIGIAVDWMVCVRPPKAVAQSLYMRDRFTELKSVALWLKYNLALLKDLSDAGSLASVHFVPFGDCFAQDSSTQALTQLLDACALDSDSFYRFFDANLVNAAPELECAASNLHSLAVSVHDGMASGTVTVEDIEHWYAQWIAEIETLRLVDLQYDSLSFLQDREKAWVSSLEKAVNEKNDQISNLEVYVENLSEAIGVCQTKLINAKDEIAEKDAQARMLLRQSRSYFLEASKNAEQIEESRRHCEDLTAQLEASRQHIDRIYRSMSWKLTRPVRVLRRVFSRHSRVP